MDHKAFRREFFLNLLASPVTLVPLLAGITGAGVGIIATVWQVVAAGVVLAAGSVGVMATRFFLETDKVAQDTFAQLERRAQEQNEQQLDALRARLLEDRDPRNENMLDELRRLVTTIKSRAMGRQGWVAGIGTHVASEMLPQVQSLFEECLRMLEQTLELWRTSQGVRDRGSRQRLLDQREAIFTEIQRSIGSLTQLIGGIQELGNQPITGSGDSRLEQVREELGPRFQDPAACSGRAASGARWPSLDEVIES